MKEETKEYEAALIASGRSPQYAKDWAIEVEAALAFVEPTKEGITDYVTTCRAICARFSPCTLYRILMGYKTWTETGAAPEKLKAVTPYTRPSRCKRICRYNLNGGCTYKLDASLPDFPRMDSQIARCKYRRPPKAAKEAAVTWHDSHSIMWR